MDQQKVVKTNEQNHRMELCARLDELEQIQNRTVNSQSKCNSSEGVAFTMKNGCS